eukprot:3090246-Rhodomonas_salina.1
MRCVGGTWCVVVACYAEATGCRVRGYELLRAVRYQDSSYYGQCGTEIRSHRLQPMALRSTKRRKRRRRRRKKRRARRSGRRGRRRRGRRRRRE